MRGQRTAFLLLVPLWLLLPATPAWCDLHLHSHGSGGPPDPHVDAFVSGLLFIVASSLSLLVVVSPILFLLTRRILDFFWAVPLANLLVYLAWIALQDYPGGPGARFRTPGLWYTIAEAVLLLAASLAVTLILAAIRWLSRKLRPPREAANRAGP